MDSAVFVPFAFGSLTLLPRQLAGKALATVVVVAGAVPAAGGGTAVKFYRGTHQPAWRGAGSLT